MTLDLAMVDIENAFSPGQAYVGLSRCRSPEGLQLLGWGGKEALRRAIKCCPIVCRFDAVLRQKWKWTASQPQATIPEYDDDDGADKHDEKESEQEESEEEEEWVEAEEEWEPVPEEVTTSPVRKKQRIDYSDLDFGAP
ncbi:hypothetical protein K440DRAFT_624011 [Wilcoxina mikolae CBS 423.85]|nr:hypothetical protein K440DRAFT_624011 [Wilcoxina mikolae CBS 423.85]